MGFLTKLRAVGKLALFGTKIAAKVAPIPYASLVVDAVEQVEDLVGDPGQGSIKKELATRLILASLQSYERMQGRELYDEKKIVESLGPLIDVTVDVLNMTVWRKK